MKINLKHRGENKMKKGLVLGTVFMSIAGLSLLGGCADKKAREMAVNAQTTADNAQACCNVNVERMERTLQRMYQKIMTK